MKTITQAAFIAKMDKLSSAEHRRNWILSHDDEQIEELIVTLVESHDIGRLGFVASTLLKGRDRFCENCSRSTLITFIEAKGGE